jgi:uncharacterized protein YkwD
MTRRGAGRDGRPRAEWRERRRRTPISCVCKDACALSARKPNTGSRIAALLVAGIVVAGALAVEPRPAGAARPCANAYLQPNGRNVAAVDRATLCLIDRVRAAHGVRGLRPNGQLHAVAASQVASMLRWNYFADVRPSGQTPLALVCVTPYRAHNASVSVGQNIAWASGGAGTPAHMVAEWMASPPHREIMLSGEYRDAGVAVASALPSVLDRGSRGAVYAVEFGVRR